MSDTAQLIAVIAPKPGKTEEVIQGLQELIKGVEANEPNALRYELFSRVNVQNGEDELIFIEEFKDLAAVEAHRAAPHYTETLKRAAEQDLLAAPPNIKVLKHVAGFRSRN